MPSAVKEESRVREEDLAWMARGAFLWHFTCSLKDKEELSRIKGESGENSPEEKPACTKALR